MFILTIRSLLTNPVVKFYIRLYFSWTWNIEIYHLLEGKDIIEKSVVQVVDISSFSIQPTWWTYKFEGRRQFNCYSHTIEYILDPKESTSDTRSFIHQVQRNFQLIQPSNFIHYFLMPSLRNWVLCTKSDDFMLTVVYPYHHI